MATVPNMPMMTGTNLPMFAASSMATPGFSTLTPMTGYNPIVPSATGPSPLIASNPSRPMMPTMGNATLPNGSFGGLDPFAPGASATGRDDFAFPTFSLPYV